MFVYLLGEVDRCHKIGRSRNPAKRVENWAKLPIPPKVIHTIQSDRSAWLENYLHRVFEPLRVNGEWFQLGTYFVEFIRGIAVANSEADLPPFCAAVVKAYHQESRAHWKRHKCAPSKEHRLKYFYATWWEHAEPMPPGRDRRPRRQTIQTTTRSPNGCDVCGTVASHALYVTLPPSFVADRPNMPMVVRFPRADQADITIVPPAGEQSFVVYGVAASDADVTVFAPGVVPEAKGQ